MRIARVSVEGRPRIAALGGSSARLAPLTFPDDPLAGITAVSSGESEDWDAVDEATLSFLAPVARAGKIVAVGLNYADHTTETGFTQPERPLTFAKYSSSLTGPHDDVVVPGHLTTQADFEVELVLVIGRRCGGRTPASIDDVAAYTVANDVSARDVQFEDQQWTRGKSFDTFTPLGPWLVTPEEFGDPRGHRIYTEVNGQRLQDASTADMIFDVPALLAFVSDGVTLEPGDLILTGTPAGAGAFRTPPRYLQDGDLVVCGIDGIGELRNRVTVQREEDRP